jgi:hypothetical protein
VTFNCTQRSAVCACCRSIAVAWVFAIVLDVEIFQVHEIIEKRKNHDTKWERPGVQPGPAGWFCGGGASRQAGLINHRLVFGILVQLSARKNQPKAIAYTDLLAHVFYILWYMKIISLFFGDKRKKLVAFPCLYA